MAAPDILVRRGLDRGLMGSTLASAAIHVAVVALLVTMPGRSLSPPAKLESYTVDLVAPDVLGGTNLVPGGGQAKAPAAKPGPPVPPEPRPELAAAQPPAPAPPKEAPMPAAVEPAKPPPAPPPPAAAMQPVEAPKAVEPPPVVEPPQPVEPPKAVREVPQPAAPPPKAPEAKPVAPPKPAPLADAKPPPPKPAAKPVAAPPAQAKAAAPAKPLPVPVAKPAEPPKKPVEAAKAAPATNPIDDEIAAAVQRRAAQVQSGSAGATRDLDKQIAAAVARRAQQVGAGASASAAGGPVSLGPASGAGGTPAGIDYILYQGKMEQKIKAAWAWAGADKALRAVLQFNLEPDGQIKNVRTVESSGDAQYDASCERAVRAVNPLEPVPERYRKEFATVELTFKPEDVGH